MTVERTDYTDKFGPQVLPAIRTAAAWPMYSYDRPAYLFWNGFANALKQRGLSDEQIKAQLQSKGTRHFLDRVDEQIEDLGFTLGCEYGLYDLTPAQDVVGPEAFR